MATSNRPEKLSDRERAKMLRAFDELVLKIPRRNAAAVDREIAQVRQARTAGGRRTQS